MQLELQGVLSCGSDARGSHMDISDSCTPTCPVADLPILSVDIFRTIDSTTCTSPVLASIATAILPGPLWRRCSVIFLDDLQDLCLHDLRARKSSYGLRRADQEVISASRAG